MISNERLDNKICSASNNWERFKQLAVVISTFFKFLVANQKFLFAFGKINKIFFVSVTFILFNN